MIKGQYNMIRFITNCYLKAPGRQASDPKLHLTTIYDEGTIREIGFLKNLLFKTLTKAHKQFLPNTTPHSTITSKIA
jgi:hypothetical protein